MAYAQPGQVAVNSTVPFGAQGLDQATWSAGAADMLLQGIVSQARQYGGDASKVGMPASWPYGPLPTNSVHADGSLNPILVAQVQQYVNSSAAQTDPDFNGFVGVNFSTASPGGYMDKPLTTAERLATEKWEYEKAQDALGRATSGGSAPKVSLSSSVRTSSGGGGSSSSGTDYDARLAYEASSNNLDYLLAKQKQDLQLALMQKQFDLDNDPNNPKLKLQRDQMAQELMMFQQSLAQKTDAEEKALQLQRAKTISDYAANPGDAVAREYFLRAQGAQPLGTPVDIFTGQAGEGQMTLSELMQKQAPLLKPYLGPQAAVPPIPAAPPPTTPPPTEPPPPVPEEPVPAFAGGTGQITQDGWTRADKFITGDHPMGMPNPEMNQVRVRNGHPETKVTPLSQMMGQRPSRPAPQAMANANSNAAFNRPAPTLPPIAGYGPKPAMPNTGTYAGQSAPTPMPPATAQPLSSMMGRGRMPMFARGTGSDVSTSSFMGADDPFAGMDLGGYTAPVQNQAVAYQPSTAVSPTYNSTGQSNLNTSDPIKDPWAVQETSGVTYNASQINADPYFGTSYQGMDPNATVTNAASQYYGMTAADAFAAQQRNTAQYDSRALDDLGQVTNNQYTPLTVVGPMSYTTTGGYLGGPDQGAQAVADMSYDQEAPYAFSGRNVYERPLNQVNNQADAGILTGAQQTGGVTQSANPGAPNYVPPAGWPTGPTDPNKPTDATTTSGPVVTAPDQTKMAAGYTYTQDAQGNWHEVPPPGSKVAPDAGQSSIDESKVPPFQPASDTGQAVPFTPPDTQIPGSTATTGPANAQGYAPVTAPGTIQINGATFDVKAGDYRAPDGGWLRWNPVLNDYSPLLPSKVTQINTEADFWKLPPAEQQKILTGQQTGYALNGDWKSGLLAGLGQPGVGEQASPIMRPDQFAMLSDEEKRNLINNPPLVQGSDLPGQTFDRYNNGPMRGQLSNLISLSNPQGAMSGGQPFDYASYMIGPNQSADGMGLDPRWGRASAPIDYNKLMYPNASTPPPATGTPPAPVTPPVTPPATPPATGNTAPEWATMGGLRTYSDPTYGNLQVGFQNGSWVTMGANGTMSPLPAAITSAPGFQQWLGTQTSNPLPTGTPSTGTPPASGTPPATATPPATPPALGPNSSIQDIIAALSYGGDVYQNLPALQLLSGLLSQGEYDTIGNSSVDVPGLPVSLPSPNQAANYTNLSYLQQSNPDAFALLNSLYTAGNVPLSAIMAMAKSRAPLGSAYESSLIQT